VQTVLTQLSRLSPEPLDCIVHIGAGADADSADYSALNPKHVVLIEADPEAHSVFAERFADAPNVTVINALVAPQAGEATFHRFTLPSFNAPLGLGRLRELYPRIDLVEELRIQGQPLHEIVREPVLGARNLLIFDMPGQEAALLRSLAAEFLGRFSSIVVLASAEAWQEGAEPAEATLAILKNKNFEVAREDSEDPAWPCVLLIRDEAKAAMQQELDQRARLLVAKATQIHQQTEQINALTTERDELAKRLAALDSEHSSLFTTHSSLVTEHSSLSTLHSSLVAERDDLVTRHSSLATTFEELQDHHSSLVAERDTLSARVTTLESGNSDLSTRHHSLVTALEELQGQHSSLSTLHSSLVAERDALATQRDSLAQQCDTLSARVASLEAEDANLSNERDDLSERLAAREAEHSEVVTRNQSLATANDALLSERNSLATQLSATQEELHRSSADRAVLLNEYEILAERLAAIETSLAERNRRAELLTANVYRAEGQLQLLQNLMTRSV
jgi:FkbM family methyltransferase